MQYYLLCPRKWLKGYVLQSDREYFAKPIPIELVSSNVHTRLVTVRDLVRKIEFPASKENIKADYQLTRKQRESVHQPA